MADAIEAIESSVVSVHGRRRLPATGIIWEKEGWIVTAHHVVERDENIHIVTSDGTGHEARLIGRDPRNDLAILKVDAQLTPAQWSEETSVRVGNLVLALGRPTEQIQATLGIVSAIHRSEQVAKQKRHQHKRRGRRMRGVLANGYIMTDVVMYPGFSGGPLLGGDGLVYGLNTSGFGHGFSIAVPTKTIENSLQTLREHGKMKQGYLGIGVQPVQIPEHTREQLEQETGLLIVSVESKSPAQSGGLLVGDILVMLDEESTEHVDDLLSLLSNGRAGKEVGIKIIRGGEEKDLQITIGEQS